MSWDPFDEVMRAVPADWRRRTLVAFTAVNGDDDAATVVFTRELEAEGETLDTMAARQLLDLDGLPRLRVLAHGPFELNGATAIRLAYAWMGPHGVVEQSTVWIEVPSDRNTHVMSVTMTCAEQQAAAMQPIFGRILARLRSTPPAPATSNVVPAPAYGPLPNLPMPGWRAPRVASSAPPPPSSSTPTPVMPFIPMPGVHARK